MLSSDDLSAIASHLEMITTTAWQSEIDDLIRKIRLLQYEMSCDKYFFDSDGGYQA